MSEISAYEKMLKDGTAFKKMDMQRIQNQQYAEAGVSEHTREKSIPKPLGEQIKGNQLEDDYTDFSAIDEAMQKRMNALKEKINPKNYNESDEIIKLKKRVKQLEEAMILIMQTQEKLLG